MDKLELTTRVIQKNLCAKLNCDVDSGNAGELREALQALADQTVVTLFLDLSAVRKMDSAGIAVLVETHERLQRSNRRLALVQTAAAVHGMLELMGVFEMYADLDAGLNAAEQTARRLHDSTRLLG